MMDIRTVLILATTEDRYQPTLQLRAVEQAVLPILRRRAPSRGSVANDRQPVGR